MTDQPTNDDTQDLDKLDVHAWAKEAARASILDDLTTETRELSSVVGDLASGVREYAATAASQEDLRHATHVLDRTRKRNNRLMMLMLLLILVQGGIGLRQGGRTATNTHRLEKIAGANRQTNKTNNEILTTLKSAIDPKGKAAQAGQAATLRSVLVIINDNRKIHGLPPITGAELTTTPGTAP